MKKAGGGWTLENFRGDGRETRKTGEKTFTFVYVQGLAIFFVILLGTPLQSVADSYCFALPEQNWSRRTLSTRATLISNLILKAQNNAQPRYGDIGVLQTSKISAPAGTQVISSAGELIFYFWVAKGNRWELSIDPDLYGLFLYTTNIESQYANFGDNVDGVSVVYIPRGSDPSKLYPYGCPSLPKPVPTNTPNPDPGKPDCPQTPLN